MRPERLDRVAHVLELGCLGPPPVRRYMACMERHQPGASAR